MTKDFDLIAELRDEPGTSNSRRLRRSGMVPAVIYGAGQENLSLVIDHNLLLNKLASENFLSSILSLKIQDREESVLIKDIQVHPSKRQVMHLDLQRESPAMVREAVGVPSGMGFPVVVIPLVTLTVLMTGVKQDAILKEKELPLRGSVAHVVEAAAQDWRKDSE